MLRFWHELVQFLVLVRGILVVVVARAMVILPIFAVAILIITSLVSLVRQSLSPEVADALMGKFVEDLKLGSNPILAVILGGTIAATAGILSVWFRRIWALLRELLSSESASYGGSKGEELDRTELRELSRKIDRLQSSSAHAGASPKISLSEEERQLLLAGIAESAGEKIKAQIESFVSVSSAGRHAENYQENSLSRLAEHAGALGRRANFSLLAGLGFAFVGVGTLGSTLLLNQQPPDAELVPFVAHYAPRISIAIIVELVAFFFLRTYARTLTDIRYIQNEITNIEMKLIGLHASVDYALPKVTEKALLALIQTERNHVLEKGQTSLELERERIEAKGFTDGIAAATGFVNGGIKKPEAATD